MPTASELYAYLVIERDEVMDHAGDLPDARRKAEVCLYGGIGTPSTIYVLRTRDGRRFSI